MHDRRCVQKLLFHRAEDILRHTATVMLPMQVPAGIDRSRATHTSFGNEALWKSNFPKGPPVVK